MDSTAAEVVVEQATLWQLLAEPSISLHLPRFALFLLIALPLEIYCDRRRVCLSCSIPTITLQILTGLGGVLATYYLVTSTFQAGDRVGMPWWFYPVSSLLLVVPTLYFLRGMLMLVNEQRISHAGKRCLAVRGLIYAVTVYFAVTLITTSYRLNREIESWPVEHERAE